VNFHAAQFILNLYILTPHRRQVTMYKNLYHLHQHPES